MSILIDLTIRLKKHIKKKTPKYIYKKYKWLHLLYDRCKYRYEANKYWEQEPLIRQRILKQDKINIIFFIHSMGYWKYDRLVKLLKGNPKFHFLLIPFINPQQDKEISKEFRKGIIEYCNNEDITYLDGYNFSTNNYIDLTYLNPDIIIYTHPYNQGYKHWLIDSFKSRCLFIYTPYGVSVTKGAYFYDTYLTNIAYKIFMGSKLEENVFYKYLSSKRHNGVITGFTLYDDLQNNKNRPSPWGKQDKIKIIWAPHHSIDDSLSFSSSNFERICYNMIEIAKKYSSKIMIAFKPHPLLKPRLYSKWGVEKTDEYFECWNKMENTFIKTGDYSLLFSHSDAMIHDCASFACEYLLTGNPVFYICKGNKPTAGIDNELGLECFKHHYHGYDISEIEAFINDVINGYDPLKQKREIFVKNCLLPPNNCSVAENMFNELLKLTIDG